MQGAASCTTKTRRTGKAREISLEPVERTRLDPRSSGSVLACTFCDDSLLKANWRSFELFKYLEDETMNKCINKMKVKTFNAGDRIIKRGSIGTTMFFIDLGTARAEIRGHTAQNLKSGDFFGELAFVATCQKFLRDESDTSSPPEEAVRAADVVATSTCRILQLSVFDFMTILEVCLPFIYLLFAFFAGVMFITG
jgi:CRP-like cAMP-binding protein